MQLEALGVPTVVFATTAFEELTRNMAKTLRLPEARIVVVPHPLGGTDPAEVARWAAIAIDEVLARLS